MKNAKTVMVWVSLHRQSDRRFWIAIPLKEPRFLMFTWERDQASLENLLKTQIWHLTCISFTITLAKFREFRPDRWKATLHC